MALDPNIILRGQLPQLNDPLDAATKVMRLKDMATQAKARERIQADEDAVRAAFGKNVVAGPDGAHFLDKKAVLSDLYRTNPAKAMATEQMFRESDFKDKEMSQKIIEQQTKLGKQLAWSIHDQDSYSKARSEGIRLGLPNAETLPLQYDPGFVQRMQMATLSAEDQLKEKLEGPGRAVNTKLKSSQADYWQMMAKGGKPPAGYTMGPNGELIPLPDTGATIRSKLTAEEMARKRYDLDERRFQQQRIKDASDLAAKARGNRLPPNIIMAVEDGRGIPTMLGNLRHSIASKKSLFDPIKGTLRSLNPYDSDVQDLNSELSAVAQSVGKYLEGGVLRKEDEHKYKKMLPKLGDVPSVAEHKLNFVQKLVDAKTQAYIQAFEQGGYDVSPFVGLQPGARAGSGPTNSSRLKIGTIKKGFKYIGGDKNKKSSWEKVK